MLQPMAPAEARQALTGEASFDVEEQSRSVPRDTLGLTPPEAPSNSDIFKAMMRKHIFIAKKRKRLLFAIWPVLIYGGLTAGMYHVFGDITEPLVRAMIFAILVPLWMMFAIVGAMQASIVEIVSEKETKMKIIQEIYGLSSFMYWISWGGYFSIISVICVSAILILFYLVQPVMTNSNILIVAVIFICAYIQQFQFSAIMSIFFTRQQSASAMASFMSLIMALIGSMCQGWLQGQSNIVWFFVSLLPGVNVFNGIAAIMWTEHLFTCDGDGACYQGLGFENLFNSEFCLTEPTHSLICPEEMVKEIFAAGSVIGMLFLTVVVYGLLAWWLENTWQGEYGKAKPLGFCCMLEFMRPRRAQTSVHHSSGESTQIAMSIRHLTKKFSDKVAVDDMTFDVYGGEIFALLGHNGAGKTTAINCIIGLIPPTSGGAIVNGFNSETNVEDARRQLSICPQDNPFYDVFTVRQHLVFFAKLRGAREENVQERLMEVLSALGIPEKVDELCKTLSGGQKRRLWVATALIGRSPIMFLDEPTSGMDPSSRRELWDLLLREKDSGRCIIFTTHYLEEADVLADRKAVMARGKVKALGTSRELKRQFGLGYHLKIELNANAPDDHINELRNMVVKHVNTGREERIAEEELAQAADALQIMTFTLPYGEVGRFGPLLLELDEKKTKLSVRDYTIAMTSLEEVFMTLGKQAETEAGDNRNADFREVDAEVSSENPREQVSLARSVQALVRIRLLSVVLNKRALYAAVIAPLILLAVAFFTNNGGSSDETRSSSSDIMNIAIYPAMAFGIAMIPHSISLIRDKELTIKHVQLAQGQSVLSYWLGNFVASYMVQFCLSICLIALICFTKPHGIYPDAMPLVVVEVLSYPLGVSLMAFNISQLFTSLETAVKFIPLLNMMSATIPSILVATLWNLDSTWCEVAKIIHMVFSTICPAYALPGTLVVAGLGVDDNFRVTNLFASWAAVPLYGSAFGIILYAMNLLYQDSRSYATKPGNAAAFNQSRKDADVLAEEERVSQQSLNGTDAREAACYHNLVHTYRSKNNDKVDRTKCTTREWKETHAVRGISLGINKGECFGLLGPNGAGKTTTLSILTGEVRPPTGGSVTIYGNDMSSSEGMRKAYDVLGLCPQVDPLWEFVTGREHLHFYGRIKGVPESILRQKTESLLYRLGFDQPDMDKATGKYSGGMKRKLSLGISLIGQSPLLFLDEPSAAVDAGAKRHLWKVIKRRAANQTVVLTTHSMEEAEALCDRIAIQVKGQLRCLGSPTHIKNKYGSGYQLEIFCGIDGGNSPVNSRTSSHMTQFLHQHLSPQITLLEAHASRYLYQLPQIGEGESISSLGKVFAEMHENMVAMNIIDYSLSQPSLEQVFIRFAREQDEHHEDAEE